MYKSPENDDRIYRENDGNWHVRVRGNYTLGPYSSHPEAVGAIKHYISARSPDFVSLNLPRWLHRKFWFRLMRGRSKTPLLKNASATLKARSA